MIRYTMRCDKDHEFTGWFQSSDGFDQLRAAGHVSCTHCGSKAVKKTLMAPNVVSKSAPAPDPAPDLTTPQAPHEAALARLRQHIEKTSDYVGVSFASEARAMHEGTAPERAIYGEARLDEARQLIEDGIPIAPLPFLPRRRAN